MEFKLYDDDQGLLTPNEEVSKVDSLVEEDGSYMQEGWKKYVIELQILLYLIDFFIMTLMSKNILFFSLFSMKTFVCLFTFN